MRKFLLCFAILVGLWYGRASATPCNPAHTFITGEVLTAAVLNANPNNEKNCFGNIDNTNIGAAGIYASQISPTSIATATFAGSFGYTFSNGLTVNGGSTLNGDITVNNNITYPGILSSTTPYGNNPSALFPIRFATLPGSTDIGASSGVSVAGITCSVLCVGTSAANYWMAIDNAGNAGFGGHAAGVSHNACSSSSGWPCEAAPTCTLSGGSCSMTVTVPAGSVCTATNVFESGVTPQFVEVAIASTTLTVTVSYSGGTNGAANVSCL